MNLSVIENEILDFENFINQSTSETRGYRPTDVVFRGLLVAEKLNTVSEKRFALVVEGMLDLVKLVQVQLNGYRQPQAVLRFKFSEEKGWLKNQEIWKNFWSVRLKLGKDLYLLEASLLEELEAEAKEFCKALSSFIKDYVPLK